NVRRSPLPEAPCQTLRWLASCSQRSAVTAHAERFKRFATSRACRHPISLFAYLFRAAMIASTSYTLRRLTTGDPMTVHHEGRRLLRPEVRNAATPVERKPPWLKVSVRSGPDYRVVANLVESNDLHTVCQEAGCPNIFECWEDREATFLIGGSQCTRRCDFCQIDTGKPAALDT